MSKHLDAAQRELVRLLDVPHSAAENILFHAMSAIVAHLRELSASPGDGDARPCTCNGDGICGGCMGCCSVCEGDAMNGCQACDDTGRWVDQQRVAKSARDLIAERSRVATNARDSLEEAKAMLPPAKEPSPPERGEIAWLVERAKPGHGPRYLCRCDESRLFDWGPISRALRLSRREDAEEMLTAGEDVAAEFALGPARVTEHEWVPPHQMSKSSSGEHNPKSPAPPEPAPVVSKMEIAEPSDEELHVIYAEAQRMVVGLGDSIYAARRALYNRGVRDGERKATSRHEPPE